MPRLPLALLLILALAVPALAEDPPAKEVPKKDAPGASSVSDAAWRAAAAKWPAPSAETAFRFEAVAVMGEAPIGELLIEVGPHTVEGKVVGWRIHERLTMDFGGKKAVGDAVFHCGLDLTPKDGKASDTFEGEKSMTWATKDGVTTVTHTVKGKEPQTWTTKAQAWMLPGKAGLFMAARFAPMAKASWAGNGFSGTDDDGPTAAFTMATDPEARHEGQKVLGLDGVRRTDRVQMWIDPKTREVLSVRMTKTDSALELRMIPKSNFEQDDIFARAPKTAQEGAAHVMRAFLMKDRAAIEKGFRWDSMYASVKKQLEAAGKSVPTAEEFKKSTLDTLMKVPTGLKPTDEQVKGALLLHLGKAKVIDTPEGWKAIVFPKAFAPWLVVMEKKGDEWKAVGLRKYG